MALSARELFLIVRAQNQASGVLRRVGADVAGLGAKEQLRARQLANTARQQAHYTRGLRLQAQGAALAEKYSPEARTAAQNALENDALNLTNKRAAAYSRLKQSTIDINALDERRNRVMKSDTQTQMRWASAMEGAQRRNMNAGNEIERLNKELAKNGAAITQSGKHWDEVGKKVQFAAKQYPQAITRQQQLNSQFAKGDAAIDRFNARMRQHTTEGKKIAEENKAIAETQKAIKFDRLQTGVHLLSSMGRQLQLVGFGGAAALGFAANAAANLSSSVTLATTQYQNNVQKIKGASDVNFGFILKQMREFPSAAEDMSKSLYDIFSTLNVNGPRGRDILEQVNKAAVAGQISTQEATSGVLSVLSNFKNIAQTGKGTEGALNRMFAAVRFGRVTMAEFSASLQTTAPAANQTGQSFDNLAGSVAFLSRSLGISKASVGYARLLQQLTSTAMVAGLKQHGIAVRDASGHYKQLDQILGQIVQKFPKLTTGQLSAQNFFKSISGTTGTIQGARAMTTLVTNMSGYRDILAKTTNDNNEFQKSFDALNQTAGVQFARALNVLKSLWLELGRSAIPTIAKLLSPIGELSDKLSQMDQATKDNIGRFLAIGVAITAVTGVVLSLAGALGGALLIFMSIGGGVLLGIAAGFLAIAAAIYLIITHWDKIGPRLQSALPAIQNAIVAAVGGIGNILEKTAGLIADFVGIIDALIRGDWGDLWNSAGEAVGHFSDLITIAFRGLGQIVSGFFTMATSSIQGYLAAVAVGYVVITRFAAALRVLATAYTAVTEAQVTAGVASKMAGGGFFANIGAGIGSFVSKLRGLQLAYKESRTAGLGFRASLAALAPQMGEAIGPAGAVVASFAAVGLALYGITKIATSVGSAWVDPFTAKQQQLASQADQVASAVDRESAALHRLGDAALAFTGAQLDQRQAQLDVLTTRRALTAAQKQARDDGKVTQAEKQGIEQLRINYERAKVSVGQTGSELDKARAAWQKLADAAKGALASTPGAASQTLRTAIAQRAQLTAKMSTLRGQMDRGELPGLQASGAALQMAKYNAQLRVANHTVEQIAGKAPKLAAVPRQIANLVKAVIPDATGPQIDAIFRKMQAIGKIMTPHQMKLFLKTDGAEKTVKTLKDVKNRADEISKHKVKQIIEIETRTKGGKSAADTAREQFQAHHAMGAGPAAQITANPAPAIAAAKKAGDAIDKVGRKHVHPTVNTQFKPGIAGVSATANGLGTAAKDGVLAGASGLGDQLGAQMAGDVTRAIAQAKAAAESKSPSKKTQREIGLPLAQGIIKGFSDEMKRNWGKTAKSVQRLIMKGLDLTGSAKEKGKAIADAFKQAMDTAVQTLTDKWTEIHDLNQQNFGELFQSDTIQAKVDWGAALSIGDLQTDLNKQLRTFRTFNASLTRLQRRGGPKTLIDQLRQLGPSAQGELDALNGATKSELKKYERTWKASQRAINQATKQQFKQQIRDWQSQGRAVAAGILMGLRSEQGGLERYFKHVWLRMIQTTRKANKSHSPSLLYAQEGVNIIEGLRMGMQRASTGLAVPMPGVGLGGGRRGSQGGPQTVIYQTVNAHHSESLDTTLRKASFRLKHRNR